MTSPQSTFLRRAKTAFAQRNPNVGTPGLLFILALSTIPLGVLIFFVWRFSLPVPIVDQWHFVPLLMMADDGTLTLSDIWAQHNEHRIPVSRLILIPLAMLTNWTIAFEIGLNVLCGVAIFVVYSAITLRAANQLRLLNVVRIVPFIAFAILSVNQTLNWLVGYQVAILLCVLAAVGSVAMLGGERLGPVKFGIAILLATISTYSFGSGAVCWIAAAPVLLARPGTWQRILFFRLIPWATAGTCVIWFYFWDYQEDLFTVAAAPQLFSRNLPLMIEYTFVYLGKFVYARDVTGAAICGAVGIAIQTIGFIVAMVHWKKLAFALAPIYALSLFAIGNALLTASGRAAFFPMETLLLSGRYNSFSMLLWLSVFVSVAFLLAKVTTRNPADAALIRASVWVTGASFVLLVALAVSTAITSYAVFGTISSNREAWRKSGELLVAGETDHEADAVLCWCGIVDPDHRKEIMEEYIPFLREKGMAGF